MDRPLVMPHEFVGRLDRWCEVCNLPDRHPLHKILGPAGAAAARANRIVEREEPHEFDELDHELDARVEALRRGRTDWGCDGRHAGNYTAAQIAAGAPDCPREMHHHHDAFCREPSPLELRLAGVSKPVHGWGSRA